MKTIIRHAMFTLLFAAAVLSTTAHAGLTDIASTPMASSGNSSVKPNVMFILDDSGSMDWEYLPDSVNSNNSRACYRHSSYNGVYYNPDVTYDLPVDAAGLPYPNSSFTAASTDGFFSGSSTINLASQFSTGNDSGGQTAYYYNYTGSSPATPVHGTCYADTSYTKVVIKAVPIATIAVSGSSSAVINGLTVNGVQIMSGATTSSSTNSTVASRIAAKITLNGFSASASGTTVTITGPSSASGFTPTASPASGGTVTLTATAFSTPTAADIAAGQNFANWYTYYRNRIRTMKSAAGLAFKNIDNKFRVGFTTITDTGVDSTQNTFLKIADFDSPQKTSWYSKLYVTGTPGFTPLRGALSKVGRIYAGQLLTGADDPVQYSCQQNFTILSTDGYWNTNSESSSYGPYQITSNTGVGNQDGAAPRPMNDGGSSIRTVTTTWNGTSTTVTTAVTPKTTLNSSTSVTTTTTPIKGWSQDVYTLVSAGSAKTNSTVGRPASGCSTCTVTITTSTNHGFVTGDSVTVAGVTVASGTNNYNGTFTVTRISNTQFSYVVPTRPASAANKGTSIRANAGDCADGQGKLQTQVQHRDEFTNSTVTDVTTTTTPSTDTTVTTSVTTTPYTRVLKTTNGIVTSDVTTPGTSSTTNTPVTTTTTGTPVTASTSNTVAGANTFSAWSNFGTATTGAVCTTLPSPNPSTAVQLAGPSSNTPTVTGPTVTPSTTTTPGATTTSSVGPTTATGPITTTGDTTTLSGGYSNTLADVAMYYYQTDLRTSALGNCTGALGAGVDVCENNVPGSGADVNSQQHMTTFTLGLGADGTLGYADNYLSGGSADYNAIVNGTKNWPDPISNTGPERIDDLWHAAVNGRGVYYSAKNSSTLITGISNALAGVTARAGSAAAAATSNLEPVAGDNYLFVALYRTVFWDGDLQAKTIDPITGAVSTTPIWSAQPLLDTKTSASSDTRTIYTFDSTGTNKVKPFLWANLDATEQGYFSNICSPTALLSQCPTLSVANQTAASGANLVNYLRGQSGNAGTLYRQRDHVMGDMVGSQPVYVKKPPFDYVDTNYTTYRDTTQAARAPIVYVAANDGMLHAFDGVTGVENWSYIPPMVMSNLYRLADTTYSVNHRYYVDGSPTAADICPNAPATSCAGNQWKTILVGGLNAGGRGYYALDITDPTTPRALWNFTTAEDADLGYSFGTPIVTKRKDGTWVVVVTSGYNNVSPGDGKGYIYVLNANSGALLEKIGTGVGSTASPSGLAKINVWINTSTDNTAERFYGGDLLGNVWRFTLDSAPPAPPAVSTAGTAFQLAQVGGINGAGVQPITTKPELTLVPYSGTDYSVVEFGTGRYLGLTDLANTDQQSIYAIKDNLSNTGLGQVRAAGVLVQQTLTDFTNASGQQARSTSNNPVDWTTHSGWYMDLNPGNTSPGERVNVDVQLQLGSLTVASNVPSNNACNVGGYSFLYNIDFKSGTYLSSAALQTVGVRLSSNAMVAGMNTIRLQSGKIMTIVTDTGGGITAQETPLPPTGAGSLKRSSWRELIQ